MSVSRDRWQLHLKARGQYYADRSRELLALHAAQPASGADIAALALGALGECLERVRAARLTRHQHVLLRLGEMICWAEGAAAAARRAASLRRGERFEKSDVRFEPEVVEAMSRIYAREAALEVANGALRWVMGAGGVADGELAGFSEALGLPEIHRAQGGLLDDMDRVADALVGRP